MKRIAYIILLLLLGVALVVPIEADAERSAKRGISQNGFTYPEEIEALTPGVCWYYNWGITPNATESVYDGWGDKMEFCPMIWGGRFDEAGLRTYLTEHPEVKYILGFNEPNFKAQANLTPTEAAAIWPTLEAIAEEFNVGLVGPALNYSPDAPYTNPTTWYDEFFELYPEARVDYIGLHCYMISADGVMNFIDTFAERYGRQIWLTEFCAWDGLTNDMESARKIQRDEMVRKVEAMELSNNVFRYSWFKAKGGENSYPYYSLLKYKNDNQGIPAGTLTDLGKVYVYMSVFDTTKYYAPDVEIAASDYVKSYLTSVNVNTDPLSTHPLQVEGFSNMRTLDYLIDVPVAGEYRIDMRVSTAGLPVNVLIGDEVVGSATWETTGDQGVWGERSITVQLPAGKHRLQLKGTKLARYCDISTLTFKNTAGVERIEQDVALRYVRQGNLLYCEGNTTFTHGELYNLSGACITAFACSDNVVDMRGVANGFYILRLYDNNGCAHSTKLCWE